MPAINVDVVAGRIFFVEFYIGNQSAAGVTRFQQIMTQHSVLREASGQGPLEGVDIVDSFADKRTFAKKILIHIGHRPRVRIDPRVAREKPDEPRAGGARQTYFHPRLQKAITFSDNLASGVELRPIQRMRHRCRELTGGVARQLGVGIERDDVIDFGQNAGPSDNFGKAIAATAPQEGIELREFSPFAFGAHPQALSRVP